MCAVKNIIIFAILAVSLAATESTEDVSEFSCKLSDPDVIDVYNHFQPLVPTTDKLEKFLKAKKCTPNHWYTAFSTFDECMSTVDGKTLKQMTTKEILNLNLSEQDKFQLVKCSSEHLGIVQNDVLNTTAYLDTVSDLVATKETVCSILQSYEICKQGDAKELLKCVGKGFHKACHCENGQGQDQDLKEGPGEVAPIVE